MAVREKNAIFVFKAYGIYSETKIHLFIFYMVATSARKNILHRVRTLLLFLVMIPFLASFQPQEAKVNQRKINKERARKEKKAQKDYEKAVREHNKMQSKETKAMMKQARKDSKKNTPVRKKNPLSRPGKKSCK
jgi:hypothetical protein